MEVKSSYYAVNAARPVGDIISSSLEDVINELIIKAGYNMDAALSSEADHKRLVELVSGVLRKDFKNLPLYRVAEGFYRGSLGELEGTTKLSVRNIIIWMRNIDAVHRQQQNIETRLVKDQQPKERGCQFGATAIRLKMQWRLSNRISADDWDNYPVKSIFTLLESGRKPEEIIPEEVRL